MVGAAKPNRSEDQGSREAQEQHTLQVRAYLDANAPKRQLKPSRSDAAEILTVDHDDSNDSTVSDPPERTKYLQLLAHGAPLETMGSGDVNEDYTESEYYRHMAAIDKAHHTTGTGFIKVDKTPVGFRLLADPESGSQREHHGCNPAMNDWEPAPNTSLFASSKPSRSESSSEL